MRQQGANLFDKGLNLDTNPIAMDNHTLTGALNATMVTMNGNELVLLNDMGNAKVDLAQLPEGYVPVGMKEHGGIVYVASYNPLKGESLIGCFPSPLRNISLDDAGTPETGLKPLIQFIEDIDENNIGTIKNVTDRVLLIGENDDIVRTGDKFVITYNNANPCDYEVNYNYIKLRALIINSDGTSIDISDELIDMTLKYSNKVYDGSDQSPIAWGTAEAIEHTSFIRILHNNDSPDNTDYSIHKNKICGKLYLLAELKLPAYINVSLITDIIPNDADHLKLTITPRAYNESGESWNGNGSKWWGNNLNDYDITVKNGNTVITQVDGSYTVPKDAVIEYIVYPKYNYGVDDNNRPIYGRIESLKRTDIIDISAIGSGEVDFHNSIFRYYNDFATDKFVFDYSLKAYIDSNLISDSSYQISELYLELINIKDLYTDSGLNLFKAYNLIASSDIKKINLDTNDYFGNYTKFISFETDIDKGNYYIGRISSKITKNYFNNTPSEDRWYYSDWYAVITSTITNKLYLDSFDNMIIIQDNPVTTNSTPEIPATITLKVFDLDWEANISREKIVDSSATDISSDSNSTNILTEPPSDVQAARIKYETVKTGIATYKHDIETSVPISENENYGFPFDLSFTADLANVDYHDDIKYSTEISRTGELTDATVPSVDNLSIPSIEPLSKNKIWYNISNNNLTINYELYSLLFAKLAKNPNATGETVNDYKFTMNTIMPAFIPYMPKHYSELGRRLLENVLGPLSSIKTNSSGALLNAEISEIYPQYWFNYALNCRKWWGDSYGTEWHLVRADQYIGIMEGVPNLVTPIDSNSEASLNNGTLLNINGWQKISYLAHQLKTNPAQWTTVKLNLETITSNIGHPTFLLWYGIVNDWSNLSTSETLHGTGTSTYCIPIMLDKYGYPYILKTFYLSRKDLLVDIVKNFNSIYVQQPDLSVDYDYWIGSNEISKFVYTNNYSANTSYNVIITTNDVFPTINDNLRYNDYNKHINSINNKVEFDNKSLYLPKFKLVNKSFDQNYTDSYNCPDLSVKNAQFLDTNIPVLDSCAIVFDGSGQRLVTEAKKVKLVLPSIEYNNPVPTEYTFCKTDSANSTGTAQIDTLKGKTLKWNQMLQQGKLVDLGLPSGLLWATSNIDITQEDGFAASPFQYGCTMFSWGNIEGHNTPNSGTTFDYNWGSANAAEPWYEGQPYGETTGAALTADIVAGDTQDAARYNLGSLFKMPTSAQFKELIDNCDFIDASGNIIPASTTDKRVTVNGIVGLYLQSKTNGNRLFFSASGLGNGSSWIGRGSYGIYWFASFYSSRYAWSLYFSSGGVRPQDYNNRFSGFAVRAVVNPNTVDTGHNNHKYLVTKDINVDLTLMFGAGNEPSTVAKFKALYPLDYYDYTSTPILINNAASGIVTTGFNQWDEEWRTGDYTSQGVFNPSGSAVCSKNPISIIANTSYFVKLPNGGYFYFYDANMNFISERHSFSGAFSVTTPGNAAYANFNCSSSYGTTYNHDICINISDTAKNGTYEPYEKHTLDFNEAAREGNLATITGRRLINGVITGNSVTVWENGMKSVGSYFDFGKVATDGKIHIGTRVIGSRIYASGDENNSSVVTNGVTTYYVLDTPEEYLLDHPIPTTYTINNYGTQQRIPEDTVSNVMAPISYTVKYSTGVARGHYEMSNAKFDQPDHAYLYIKDDENGKPILMDCLDPDNALNYAYSYTLGQWGYNIALALRNNKLQIETDNLHNRKNIVVNNTNTLITSTNWWLGNAMKGKHGDWRFSRRKITDLAKDHVINLDLFKTTLTTESF